MVSDEEKQQDETGGKKEYSFEDILKDAEGMNVEKETATISMRNLFAHYTDFINSEEVAGNSLRNDPEYVDLMTAMNLYENDTETWELKSSSMKVTRGLAQDYINGVVNSDTEHAMKEVVIFGYSSAMAYITYMDQAGNLLREINPTISDPKDDHAKGTKFENLLRDAKIAAVFVNG